MNEKQPFDDDGKIDYQRWLRMNAFIGHLHKMHRLAEQESIKAWRHRRNEMLLDLDMIDNVVDMMEDYPEAEAIINKILRRIDNDKKY